MPIAMKSPLKIIKIKLSNWVIASVAILLQIILISLFTMHYSALRNERNYSKWVDHSNEVISTSNEFLSTVLDAETDQRGYIITGDEKFLKPYYGLRENATAQLNKLKTLTKGNPVQYLRVDTLVILCKVRFDFLNEGILYRQQNQSDEVKQFIASNAGKYIMDKFRRVINSFNAEEQRLLKKRGAAADRQTNLSFETLFVGASIIMLIFSVLFIKLIREINKRKSAHADLFISREWFSKTLLSTGDGVIATDQNGIITFMNRVAEDLTGWTLEETKGKALDFVFDIIDETTRLPVENPLAKALKQNQVVLLTNHTILIKKDNTQHYIFDSAAPVHNQNFEVVGAVLIFRDVTDQSLARKKLAEIERRLKDIVDNTTSLIYINDLEGKYLMINRQKERVFNIKASDIIGKESSQYHPAGVGREFREAHNEVIQQERLIEFDKIVKHADGSFHMYHTAKFPLYDSDGKVYAVGAVSTDITESKRNSELQEKIALHEALLESETRFRSLIENSHDMLTLITAEGVVEYISPAVEKTFGYTNEENRIRTMVEVVHPDDLETAQAQLKTVFENPGVPIFATIRNRKKDGDYIWVEGSITNMLQIPGVNAIVANFRDVTENKKLESQKALFASIVNSSDDAIISKSLEGIITSWNCGAEKLFGYSEKEIIGKHMSILIPKEHLHEETDILESIKLNKSVGHYEAKRVRKDGSHIHISLTVSPIRDIKGNVTGASKIAHDITERKNAEIALHESEVQIQAIINASQDAVLVINETGMITKWDSKSEALFGWNEQEALGKGLTDMIIPPRFREMHRKGLKHFLATGEGPLINKSIEITVINKSNIEFDISLSISPVVIKGKYHFVAFIRDVTLRKREEIKLHLSEERYRQIVETAHEGIWTTDENNKTNFVNEKMCQILEYSCDEMMGKELSYFMDNEGKTLMASFFENQKNEVNENFEFKYTTKSGKQIWGNVTANPIFGEDHKFKGTLAMITDITDRKKMEGETLELVESLQKRNNELRQFTYVISHNLRSPVAKILGLASLFESDPQKENINQTVLSNITVAVANLDSVIKDLNTVISPRESGNEPGEYVLFESKLDRVKQSLESEIMESNAMLQSDFHQVKGMITIKSYLYSIMYNLVSNAIKFRSPGVPLEINLQTTRDKEFICLSVKDNGMGIDLKKHGNEMFGLYKRFHGENVSGRGIGLNLIKAQIESMGGRVEVESEVNQGATFKVFLPKKDTGNVTN